MPEAQNIGVYVPQIRRRPVLLNSSCICLVNNLTNFVLAHVEGRVKELPKLHGLRLDKETEGEGEKKDME